MRHLTVLLIAVAMLTASCSSGTTDTTTTPATVTTAAPTTTLGSDEESMVLVAFGDSLMTHLSAPVPVLARYAEMLEEEFGVPVDVRNYSVYSSSPTDLLKVLDSSEVVQESLGEADVVLLEIPQGEQAIFMTATGWQGRDPADCGGDDNEQCLRDYVTENKASVEEIFAKITAICDPSDTLIRALTMYQMDVKKRKAEDALQVTVPYFTEAQDNLEVIAAGYGIPVADVYDEFMGPDGTNDPQDRGLLNTDERHPTQAGADLIAEMLGHLGYDLAN